MRYRRLGATPLKVSALALGTMNFGAYASEDESFAILDQAVDLGVNLVDTANQYGGRLGVGATEEILGRWLARSPDKRDKIVLATKVYEPMSDDPNDRGLSARHIRHACEASLKRLGVDHLDLYQMHHIDRAARPEEIWQAMDLLIHQGKIIYCGSSNFPGWKIAQMNERAARGERLGLTAEQGLYNLLERRAEMEVLPACEAYGLGFIAWSPLAGGALAGPSASGIGRRATHAKDQALSSRLTQFFKLAGELGRTPAEVALAWLLHQPTVTAAIVGPRTSDQLSSVAGAASLDLKPDALAAINALFPVCGPAPEAFAW